MFLYIVATPIGNLEDITLRALRTLREADLILCEDTRVTSKLLAHFEIKKPLESYHQHSNSFKIEKILSIIESGKKVALVSDAGTPGISDPGGILVEEAIKKFGIDIKIIPIPGADAVSSVLSVSGFPTDKFCFLGFPPNKKGRKTFFENLVSMENTIVFYESKHRINKALEELIRVMPSRQIIVARELTKQFETIYRGTSSECLSQLLADKTLGEFVVVIRAT